MLCVPDMAHFSAVNRAYAAFFNPRALPGRTCIQTSQEDRISLHCYVSRGSQYRRSSMHIQSLSHWAPASIGPYSQAVALVSDEDSFCFLSGQVAMHPEDLQLIEAHLEQECLLGLRHVSRVAWIHASLGWNNLSAMVCYCVDGAHLSRCQVTFHSTICCHNGYTIADTHCLCSRVAWVAVRGLPKGAKVEWQPIFSRNRFLPTTKGTHRDNSIVFATNIDSHVASSSRAVIPVDFYLDGDALLMSGSIGLDL